MRYLVIPATALLASLFVLWPQKVARADMIECVEYHKREVGSRSGVLAISRCAAPKLVNACIRVEGQTNTTQQGHSLAPGGQWFFEQVNFDHKPFRFTIAVCDPSKATVRADLCMPQCPAAFQTPQAARPDRAAAPTTVRGASRAKEASPLNNPGEWVTTNDYPARALREERAGRSGISFTVLPSGRVANCRVTSSSGSPDLDAAACELITTRAQYRPALNAAGKAIASSKSTAILWTLPAYTPPPAQPAPPSRLSRPSRDSDYCQSILDHIQSFRDILPMLDGDPETVGETHRQIRDSQARYDRECR